jgi:predicted TIM-barrel fold metal-dependent hydrolase
MVCSASTKASVRPFSADSHVLEPPDLWTSRVETRLRSEVPTCAIDGVNAVWQVAGGSLTRPWPRDGASRALWHGEAAGRLAQQDWDSIAAEILYPSEDLWALINRSPDDGLRLSCVKAYNDWIAEYCSGQEGRLCGVGKIPTADITSSVEELVRCVEELGLRGVVLDAWPSGVTTPSADDLRFWEKAEQLQVPIGIHRGLGWWTSQPHAEVTAGRPAQYYQSVMQLVIRGVLDEFPGLRFVCAHGEAGWLPSSLQTSDENYMRTVGTRKEINLKKEDWLPSDYIRAHCWFTFHDDRCAVANRDAIGAAHLLWAAQTGSAETAWPNNRTVAELVTDQLSVEVKSSLLSENTEKLYQVAGMGFSSEEIHQFDRLTLI